MARGIFPRVLLAVLVALLLAPLVAGLSACSTSGPEQPPEQIQDQPLRVGILIYDGVFNTEFIAPLDIFNHAAGRLEGKMEVFTVSPTEGPVTTAEKLRVVADYTFASAPAIDWLVVPSGENYRTDVKDNTLVGWIRKVGSRAKVVHSNCWGAILLGGAGLLDGKRATTFPSSTAAFAKMFPEVKVQHDALLVDDDGAVTTAGGVVSYDGALYLVEKHFGLELASGVAEGLVIDWNSRRMNFPQ